MTRIRALLTSAAERLTAVSPTPALDAEVLLSHVLNKPRSYLRAWPDYPLDSQLADAYAALLATRQQGAPIAYLTGIREFWSREFTVTPDVLIPRPDTECLIEHCLRLMPPDAPCRVLDLGTGSGIIAVTLAAERPNARISAADISPAALAIAQRNAEKHRVGIRFYHSDWFANLPLARFDLIVSNPPYIAPNDRHLDEGDLRFEPRQALVSPRQGLHDIEVIADTARRYLDNDGHLLIEHGYDQKNAVLAILNGYGYRDVQTHEDLSGHPRVSVGRIHHPPNPKLRHDADRN